MQITFQMVFIVSIQPKPKKGLVENGITDLHIAAGVSIQPKPKKGLVGPIITPLHPASDVSIQPKPKKGLVATCWIF